MDNILPSFKTFSVDEPHTRKKKVTEWVPVSEATSIPYYLEEACSKEVVLPKKDKVVFNALPPNERYSKNIYDADKPSPLSHSERGQSIPAVITVPQWSDDKTEKKTCVEPTSKDSSSKVLGIRLCNGYIEPMEFFYPVQKSIKSVTVHPYSTCSRAMSGGSDAICDYMDLYLVAAKRVLVHIVQIEDLKTFNFSPSPIGIEIEMSAAGKLMCCKVFDHSQASSFRDSLLGAEIISVNGRRVITLEEFETAVAEARGGRHSNSASGCIQIQVIVAPEESSEEHSNRVSAARMVLAQLVQNTDTRESFEESSASGDSPSAVSGPSRLDSEDTDTDNGMLARRKEQSSASADLQELEEESPDDERLRQWASESARLCLVCAPDTFTPSNQTASTISSAASPARKIMMVANFSPRLAVRLFRVEADGSVSLRRELAVGCRHSEWTSDSDVWVVSAHPDVHLETGFAHSGPSRLTEWENKDPILHMSLDGALAILLRPSRAALSDLKTASILWTPFLSLSVSQRTRKTPGEKRATEENLNPHLSVQILDGDASG